jgi:hypothetical protein
MRDNVAREKIAEMGVLIGNLTKALEKIDVDSYGLRDYQRRFIELTKELGLEFDKDGVLDREASIKSSLGRLQAQITALVVAIGHKETYVDGELRYEKVR